MHASPNFFLVSAASLALPLFICNFLYITFIASVLLKTNCYCLPIDDVSTTESNSSPIVCPRNASKSASPSPIHGNTFTRGTGSVSSADWPGNDDDIDRLVAMHHNRNSLSSLGVSFAYF